MINFTIKFGRYPASVKNGIIFLVAAWSFHYLYYFKYLFGQSTEKQNYFMIAIGLLICFFVSAINKWARAMCIFFNVAITAMYLYLVWVYTISGNGDLIMLTGLITVLFIASTYFLAKKETSRYFIDYNQTEDQTTDDGRK